ncbi:protein of unknown function [Petrocella atlantisensis]|uniref:Uncharacterized protein n=1 Tax=Petrocella atlantisensis TaxID=2173034 RepID=A0A3P7NWM0_9FIRM|nr:protein of unknown function [Petrocella atlantisensis]
MFFASSLRCFIVFLPIITLLLFRFRLVLIFIGKIGTKFCIENIKATIGNSQSRTKKRPAHRKVYRPHCQ